MADTASSASPVSSAPAGAGTLPDVAKMKVADLKRELKSRGLSAIGNKGELTDRLQEAIQMERLALGEDSALEDPTLDPTDSSLADADLLDEDEVLADESEVFGEEVSSTGGKDEEDEALLASPTKTSPPAPLPAKKIILDRTTPVVVPTPSSEAPAASTQSDAEKKVVKLTELTAEERLKLRESKFGATGTAVDGAEKKAARAQRFGITGDSATSAATGTTGGTVTKDLELLKKRATRFGVTLSKDISSLEQEEKLKKRRERFGQSEVEVVYKKVKLSAGGSTGTNGAVQKGPDPDAEKKLQRAKRFAQSSK